MSETQWTPGPWDQRRDEDGDSFIIGGGRVIANMVGPKELQKIDGLMAAAAPELYEALAAVFDDLEIGAHPHLHIDQIKAALAKAHGETS